jgi:hypothetical protein
MAPSRFMKIGKVGPIGCIILGLFLVPPMRPVTHADIINRDAASRCIAGIDAWRIQLVRIEQLQRSMDAISEEIDSSYAEATPEGKVALRHKLIAVIDSANEASDLADVLYDQILDDLESVPNDRFVRLRMKSIIAPLRKAKGIRSSEIQEIMYTLHGQLEALLELSVGKPIEDDLANNWP